MWESGATVSGAACHTEAVGALTFSKLLDGGDVRPAELGGLHHQLKAKPRRRGLLPPGYRKGTISSSDRGHVVCYQATSDTKKTTEAVQGQVWKVKGKEGEGLLPDSPSHPSPRPQSAAPLPSPLSSGHRLQARFTEHQTCQRAGWGPRARPTRSRTSKTTTMRS